MSFRIEVFDSYPSDMQSDFLMIYEDQVNPQRPDHSLLELVISLMEQNNTTLYAIAEDNNWVGAGLVLIEHGHKVMRYCCVAPHLRSHGIGKKLVDAIAEREATDQSSQLLTDIDVEDSSALKFLLNNAFVETGRDESTIRLARQLAS